MRWNLRQVMATRGLFQTSDLVPLLAERDVHLSSPIRPQAGDHSAAAGEHRPARRPLRHLGLRPERPPRAGHRSVDKTATAAGESGPGIGDLRPVRGQDPPSDVAKVEPPALENPPSAPTAGESKKCSRLILGQAGLWTSACFVSRAPRSVARGAMRRRFWPSTTPLGRPACATCTGNRRWSMPASPVAREDSPFGRKCAPCMLSERLPRIFSPIEPGGIHPELASRSSMRCMAGARPQTALYWLTRSEGSGILRPWPKATSRSPMLPSTSSRPRTRLSITYGPPRCARGPARPSRRGSSRSPRGWLTPSPRCRRRARGAISVASPTGRSLRKLQHERPRRLACSPHEQRVENARGTILAAVAVPRLARWPPRNDAGDADPGRP